MQILKVEHKSFLQWCIICHIWTSNMGFRRGSKLIPPPLYPGFQVPQGLLHSCMPSPLALDPIRVQSCVWCLFWTKRNSNGGNIYISIYLIIQSELWILQLALSVNGNITSTETIVIHEIKDEGCWNYVYSPVKAKCNSRS